MDYLLAEERMHYAPKYQSIATSLLFSLQELHTNMLCNKHYCRLCSKITAHS